MDAYIGEIRMFAGNYAPRNWLICNGETLDISEFTELFSIIGCRYGGDCRNTFALPDLRGRVPISAGHSTTIQGYYTLGVIGGLDYKRLTYHSLPAHKHTINGGGTIGGDLKVTVGAGNTTDPSDAKSMASTVGFNGILSMSDSEDVIENCVTGTVPNTTNTTGKGQLILNMQPYVPIQYIICSYGIYPPRN